MEGFNLHLFKIAGKGAGGRLQLPGEGCIPFHWGQGCGRAVLVSEISEHPHTFLRLTTVLRLYYTAGWRQMKGTLEAGPIQKALCTCGSSTQAQLAKSLRRAQLKHQGNEDCSRRTEWVAHSAHRQCPGLNMLYQRTALSYSIFDPQLSGTNKTTHPHLTGFLQHQSCHHHF